MSKSYTSAKFVKVGVIIILTIMITCLGAIAIETRTMLIRRAYDNYILDNENHYLPCEKLPEETEVNKIVREHQDIISMIEQVNPGQIGVDIDIMTCPGKADLIIWYATHQDRVEIKRIIGENTFFGVPYRMQNR